MLAFDRRAFLRLFPLPLRSRVRAKTIVCSLFVGGARRPMLLEWQRHHDTLRTHPEHTTKRISD